MRGTRLLTAQVSSYGMVPAASDNVSMEFFSPKISTSLPTSTVGMSVISIMHMSMQIFPRSLAGPSLV